MSTLLSSLRNEPDPFGAKVLDNGNTRFRLWMPQQDKILPHGNVPHVYLSESDTRIPMQKIGEGWYEVETPDATHQTPYMFEIWHPENGNDYLRIPDPMSYHQEKDIHGNSLVVDPAKIDWSRDPKNWRGVPHEELIIYELHIGTFSEDGTYQGAIQKLDYLKELGITAIEIMPLGGSDCDHNWGYDEVMKAANHTPYGTPQDLADLVQECHRRGIATILDVVDNHMGPEGNYYRMHTPELWRFKEYERLHKIPVAQWREDDDFVTSWGPAFDLARWEVRSFFAQKNDWWQKAYRLDGFRRDAVHALKDELYEKDPSNKHFLEEIFNRAKGHARDDNRIFNVILEYEDNKPSALFADSTADGQRVRGNAQWADEFHHAVRVLMFRENPAQGFTNRGYYEPYNEDPIAALAEVLSKGSALSLDTPRNHNVTQVDKDKPFDPRCSIAFTRNHDQIGNTPHGERIEFLLKDDSMRESKLKFESTLLILNPMIPMLFMGQERALETPFPYFATWKREGQRDAVRKGRAEEFPQYDDMVDPCDPATAETAKLPWPDNARDNVTFHHFRKLIAERKQVIVPNLKHGVRETKIDIIGETGLHVEWAFGNGAKHSLTINAGNDMLMYHPEDLGRGGNGEIIRHQPATSGGIFITPWTVEHPPFEKPVARPQPGMHTALHATPF